MLLNYLELIGVIVVYFSLFFLLAEARKNYGLVDIGWGLGFIVAALYSLLAGGEYTGRSLLITGLVIIWGGRLAYHLFRRNWGQPEDFRYQQMRSGWDNEKLTAFVRIFLLQGVILLFVSLPVTLVNFSGGPSLGWFDLFGLAVWGLGFFFEVVGDRQLRKFIAQRESSEEIMTEGLWRYTRHPNYFGESLLWWGFFLLALPLKFGWLTLVGPLLITYLLLYVSGVPLLEQRYEGNEEYEEYKQRTNKFFPWLPIEK